MEDWTEDVAQVLALLDQLGVVVSVSAGNEGEEVPAGLTTAWTPNVLAMRPGSPLIIVGAVNSDGQLAQLSSVGSAAVPITTYAMGKGLRLVDMSTDLITAQDGTTFSASIVVSTLHPGCPHPSQSRIHVDTGWEEY